MNSLVRRTCVVVGALALALVVVALQDAAGPSAAAAPLAQMATPTPIGPGATPQQDPKIIGRVPAAAIAYALANPDEVFGWQQLRDPAKPYHSMYNPIRDCLTLRSLSTPYHPFFNSLVFKAGCG